MKSSNKIVSILAVSIYSIGIFVGMLVTGVAAWGDFESSLFDSSVSEKGRLRISCPVVINPFEVAMVSAKFSNSMDDPIKNRLKMRISDGFVTLIRQENDILLLEPGETQSRQWRVTADDAVFNGLLVMLKLRSNPTYPLIGRQASCGILVVNTSVVSGGQLFAILIAASLGLAATGAGIWYFSSRPLTGKAQIAMGAMLALGALVLIGLVASMIGWWLLGGIVFFIGLLMIVAMVSYFLVSRELVYH
jgi:hypothetical protein